MIALIPSRKTIAEALCLVTICSCLTGCSTWKGEDRRALAQDSIQIRSVIVHPEQRELVVTGFVNQVSGPIELFACGPRGKTHESVLVVQANPLDIQTGLLLLGLKHGPPMPRLGEGPPIGDRVEIWVEWDDGRKIRRRKADQMIKVWENDTVIDDAEWTFNGSVVIDGLFQGLVEEGVVATYWDPWAIINIGLPVGSNDDAIHANEEMIPPLSTPIRLIIRAKK